MIEDHGRSDPLHEAFKTRHVGEIILYYRPGNTGGKCRKTRLYLLTTRVPQLAPDMLAARMRSKLASKTLRPYESLSETSNTMNIDEDRVPNTFYGVGVTIAP